MINLKILELKKNQLREVSNSQSIKNKNIDLLSLKTEGQFTFYSIQVFQQEWVHLLEGIREFSKEI